MSSVRVLLAERRPSVTVASEVPFSVRDGSGTVTSLPAGEVVLDHALEILVADKPVALPGPLAFRPGKGGVLSLDGSGYRGVLKVTATEGTLQVIDVVGLDAYLRGVVPGEMPKEWPAAALQAQAVAARSYALASRVKSRPFDLYPDTRNQVYPGVAAETPATNSAVKATAGVILTYGGKVASTFYYSSSGGRTAAGADVFGLVTPYLLARTDPWDTLSPFHRWAPRTFTPASLAKALGLSAPVVDAVSVLTRSGRPSSVTLLKSSGARVALTGAEVRDRLGLRSTMFRLGVLRLAGAPTEAVVPGGPVVVSGVVRNVSGPALERLLGNGTWVRSSKLVPGSDGEFTVTVRPKVTSTYRITAEGQVGPALTIAVPA